MESFEIKKHTYINNEASIKDKIVIITGCNTGIGKETARELAKRGGKIYFACRNEEKTMEAIHEIKCETANEQLYFLKLDLGSLDSIRDFSKRFHELETKLDILINNAGVLASLKRTADGFESNFGVNHLGHFLLTNLLLDMLKMSISSRIIVVSSSLHKIGTLKKDDINSEKGFDGTWKSYANSKLCNILFMRELAKKLNGTKVTINAVCPGAVRTDVINDLNSFTKFLMRPIMKVFYRSPELGCQPIVMLAVEPSLSEVTGKYFDQFDMKEPSIRGQNQEEWLWEKSLELTKFIPQ